MINVVSFLCLLAVIPLASGIECYTCSGAKLDSNSEIVKEMFKNLLTNPECANGDITKMKLVNCTEGNYCSTDSTVAEGSVMFTSVTVTFVDRACLNAAGIQAAQCSASKDSLSITVPGLKSTTNIKCVCQGDKCNGQTTIVPAVVTCFLSLLLALRASF